MKGKSCPRWLTAAFIALTFLTLVSLLIGLVEDHTLLLRIRDFIFDQPTDLTLALVQAFALLVAGLSALAIALLALCLRQRSSIDQVQRQIEALLSQVNRLKADLQTFQDKD